MKERPLLIVTGLSGSGKSTAVAALEDAGYFCVDNLPVDLLPAFLERPTAAQDPARYAGYAFGMDLRDPAFADTCLPTLEALSRRGYRFEIVFLEAEPEALVRRYSATRRRHPLAGAGSLMQAIGEEARRLAPLRRAADRVLDTSRLNVHELKARIQEIARGHAAPPPMPVRVVSFGFKHGLPPEADLLIDVRFLANPFFVPELKGLDGEAAAVTAFVLETAEAREFLSRTAALLDFLLPLYEREGKAVLTIAVGCTGGRHRSVAVARALCDRLAAGRPGVELIHRDIHLPP